MRTPTEFTPSLKREGYYLYKNALPEEELKPSLNGLRASYQSFKTQYDKQGHSGNSGWRKLSAIPGAIASFLIDAPVHIVKSGYYYTKSLFTGEADRTRSYTNLLKVGRDLEEGIGDLALLINDKAGCYLVYDAQFNKYVYDEVVQHTSEDKGAFKDIPPEILSLIAQYPGGHGLGASKALSKDIQLGNEKTGLFEKQYQELIQEITWIEGYIEHIGFANKPILEKLEAVYPRLIKEVRDLKKALDPGEDRDMLIDLFDKLPKKTPLKNLPKFIKEIDAIMEEVNYKQAYNSTRGNDVYIRESRMAGPPILSRLAKRYIQEFRDRNLQKLIFRGKCFTFVPKEIADLKDLSHLEITDTSLDYLPKEVGSLPKLQILNLANNRLRRLPKELEDLPELKWLNVGLNNLIEPQPIPQKLLNKAKGGKLTIIATSLEVLDRIMDAIDSVLPDDS